MEKKKIETVAVFKKGKIQGDAQKIEHSDDGDSAPLFVLAEPRDKARRAKQSIFFRLRRRLCSRLYCVIEVLIVLVCNQLVLGSSMTTLADVI